MIREGIWLMRSETLSLRGERVARAKAKLEA
jgi:hypothetical protein